MKFSFSLFTAACFAVAFLLLSAGAASAQGGQTVCNKSGCFTVFPQFFQAPAASASQPREFVVPASSAPTTVRIVVNEGTPSLYVLGEGKPLPAASGPVSPFWTQTTATATSSYSETTSAGSERVGLLKRICGAFKNRPRLFGGGCNCGG